MAYRCEICGKSFKTQQALSSHITYQHKRAKSLRGVITTTPPQILEDPEILELRKELEKRRLKRAIEELEDVPKIVDLAERVTRLEETIKGIQNYQTRQDQVLARLSDLVSNLRTQMDFIGGAIPGIFNPDIINKQKFAYWYSKLFPKQYKELELAIKSMMES